MQYLAFDIGGTNLKYALITDQGQMLEQGRMKTNTESLDAFMAVMYQVADKYAGQYAGIAVCAPGKIDTEKKVIHFGGALPFLDGLNLQETLGQKYNVPIAVENDGKAAALAEQWLGELKDVDTGVAAFEAIDKGELRARTIFKRYCRNHDFKYPNSRKCL